MAAAPLAEQPAETAPSTIQREVLPSASRHVVMAAVHVPGPMHEIEPAPYLRISFNIGPSYSFDVSGTGQRGAFVCKRHSLLVIPPDLTVRHDASMPKPVGRAYKPARLATFRLSRELVADCAIELGLPPDRARLRHQVVPADDVLRPLALALHADLRDGNPDGARASERLAMALVGRLLLREHHQAAGPARRDLDRVRDHIEQHLATELALDDLARVAGMSLFHFCRVFRDTTGITPHRYILARRMEHAKRLLWAGAGGAGAAAEAHAPSVLEIALACGFASPSHFSAQFKRHTGRTPLQWQRELRPKSSNG
ncbi:AraC family transcriptional regulator [Ramlibacter sp.]|uniref:AraC family transcriptional regulator n=1 Tax=Ramlibacter sp. TaxID=1917967 RepID=UPI0035B06E7D